VGWLYRGELSSFALAHLVCSRYPEPTCNLSRLTRGRAVVEQRTRSIKLGLLPNDGECRKWQRRSAVPAQQADYVSVTQL
jgi:hypothetical protein